MQKLRARKASITPSNLQKAIDSDPSTLTHTNIQPAPPPLSDTSSNEPSITSSTSSTPKTDAVEPLNTSSTDTPPSIYSLNNNHRPDSKRLQLGMMGIGGHGASPDNIGWTGEWPDFYGSQQQSSPTQLQPSSQSQSSCCQPKPSSCCSKEKPSQTSMPPLTNQGSRCNNSQLDMPFDVSMDIANPFVTPHLPIDQFLFSDSISGFGHQSNTPFVTPLPVNEHLSRGFDHNCHCGDTCACIGCATHPQNNSTLQYVRYHNELAMRMQQPPIHLNNQYQQAMGYTSDLSLPNGMQQNQLYGQVMHMHTPGPNFALPYSGSAPWALINPAANLHQTSLGELEEFQPTRRVDNMSYSDHHNNTLTTQLPNGTHSSTSQALLHADTKQEPLQQDSSTPTSFATPEARCVTLEAESADDDESISTLSPSSFLQLTVTLDGCNDGACRCGDGCQCDGCAVHRGHDVVETMSPLEPDTTAVADVLQEPEAKNFGRAAGELGAEWTARTFAADVPG